MHSHFVKKIPSEIKEATRYTLLTPFILFVLFILFKWLYTAQTVACTPVYCKGRLERYWNGLVQIEQKVWVGDCMGDTPFRLL